MSRVQRVPLALPVQPEFRAPEPRPGLSPAQRSAPRWRPRARGRRRARHALRLQRRRALLELDAQHVAHRALAHGEPHHAPHVDRDTRDAFLDGGVEHHLFHVREIARGRIEQLAAHAAAELGEAFRLERYAHLHVDAGLRRMAEITHGAREHDLRASDTVLLDETHVLDRAARRMRGERGGRGCERRERDRDSAGAHC